MFRSIFFHWQWGNHIATLRQKCDVTSTLSHFISLAIQMFVQTLMQTNNKEITKASVMRNAYPCHELIVGYVKIWPASDRKHKKTKIIYHDDVRWNQIHCLPQVGNNLRLWHEAFLCVKFYCGLLCTASFYPFALGSLHWHWYSTLYINTISKNTE